MGIYFENTATDVVAVTVLLLTTGFFCIKYWTFNYWQRRGINSMEPSFPFGNLGPVVKNKYSIGACVQEMYNNSTDRFVGMYAVWKPMLILRDPELIRNVLMRDFEHFTDRGVYHDKNSDFLAETMFGMPGERWKQFRSAVTPVFTSGKLKAMFSTLLECGESLQRLMRNAATRGEIVEFHEISARYTTDIIASVAFGVDAHTIENPEAPFRKFGRMFFALTIKNAIRNFFLFFVPKLLKYTLLPPVDPKVANFVKSLVQQTIDYREKNNVTRKDLFQLLLQLRNTGSVKSDGQWEAEPVTIGKKHHLTFNELASQILFFYLAGFETSSSTLSFCLYELAKNPDIQRKAQDDIDIVLKRNNNQITYEALAEMKYLDHCISETLRKYPVLPFLNRECTKEYRIPGSKVVIQKGTAIVIPLLGLQRDSQYYPEPNLFKPERFLDEKTDREQPYMPFGAGPRICPAMRMGLLQVKLGLLLMLQILNFSLHESHTPDLVLSPNTFVMASVTGIQLKITPRA